MAEDAPAGGGLKIGNRTIPTWAIAGGGLALVLLVLVGRNNQGQASAPDRSGVAAEDQAQQYAAFREQAESREVEFSERVAGQLESSQARLEAALSQQASATERALAQQAASTEAQVGTLRELLDRITAALGGGGQPPSAPEAPSTPSGPTLPPVTISDAEINSWAAGIGLPASWGYNFVNRFGRLPANIPELEEWRRAIGYRTDDGRWCIGIACI